MQKLVDSWAFLIPASTAFKLPFELEQLVSILTSRSSSRKTTWEDNNVDEDIKAFPFTSDIFQCKPFGVN